MYIWSVYIVERHPNDRVVQDSKTLVGHYMSQRLAEEAKERVVERGFADAEHVVVDRRRHLQD